MVVVVAEEAEAEVAGAAVEEAVVEAEEAVEAAEGHPG